MDVVVLLDQGQRYEVPFYRIDNKEDIDNDSRFTYVFYYKGTEYVYTHINFYKFGQLHIGDRSSMTYLTTGDIYRNNPDGYRNLRIFRGYELKCDSEFVVSGDKYDGEKNVILFSSDSYRECLYYFSNMQNMPDISYFFVLDCEEYAYCDIDNMLDDLSDIKIYEQLSIGVKIAYDERLEYKCILLKKDFDEYIINGDISRIQAVITNYKIINDINYLTRMLDVKSVEVFNGNALFLMDIKKWNTHLFEENNMLLRTDKKEIKQYERRVKR